MCLDRWAGSRGGGGSGVIPLRWYRTDSDSLFTNCKLDPFKEWVKSGKDFLFVPDQHVIMASGQYWVRPNCHACLDASLFSVHILKCVWREGTQHAMGTAILQRGESTLLHSVLLSLCANPSSAF